MRRRGAGMKIAAPLRGNDIFGTDDVVAYAAHIPSSLAFLLYIAAAKSLKHRPFKMTSRRIAASNRYCGKADHDEGASRSVASK